MTARSVEIMPNYDTLKWNSLLYYLGDSAVDPFAEGERDRSLWFCGELDLFEPIYIQLMHLK